MVARKVLSLLSSALMVAPAALSSSVPTTTDYIKGEDRYYYRQAVAPKKSGGKAAKKKKRSKAERVKIAGRTSLFSALSIATEAWGLKFKLAKDVKNTDIAVVLETSNPAEYIDAICISADVWCDYLPSKNVVLVRKLRTFTVDIEPEGITLSSYGGYGGQARVAGAGGEDTQAAGAGSPTQMATGGGSGSSRALTYFIQNVSFREFVTFLSEVFQVEYAPSPMGFIQLHLSPSQYERIVRYFEEMRKRTEIVNAEIKLLRVDLKEEFKWGVDWSAVFRGFRIGQVTSATVGVTSSPLLTTDPRGTLGVIPEGSGQPTGVIEALKVYGEVHTVDSWYYQMKTGTPIPFSNYRLERYFTLGATQSQSTTEITAEIHEDEVGFRGSLSLYKKSDGTYFVEGFVDISLIKDYTEVTLPGGGLQKAPNIEGKSFRIATELTGLNRTIIVGGFRTLGIQDEDRGVPLLQRIPILGYLFKGKRNLKQNSEFIVLITLKPVEEKDATELLPEEENLLKSF